MAGRTAGRMQRRGWRNRRCSRKYSVIDSSITSSTPPAATALLLPHRQPSCYASQASSTYLLAPFLASSSLNSRCRPPPVIHLHTDPAQRQDRCTWKLAITARASGASSSEKGGFGLQVTAYLKGPHGHLRGHQQQIHRTPSHLWPS